MPKYLSIKTRALVVTVFALAISTLQVPIAAPASPLCSPTTSTYTDGGTTYNVASFTTVVNGCSWTVPTGVTNIDLLLVGGGGGGGGYAFGGGGGAGGLAEVFGYSVTPGNTYTIKVGDGGSGGLGTDVQNTQGQNGGESSFHALTVIGGGGGGGWENNGVSPRNYSPGRAGASGGGSSENGGAGGAVSQTALSNSASVYTSAGGSNMGVNVFSGAGGGGAGGAGQSVTDPDNPYAGGIGRASSIRTGSPITYSAGGTGGPGLGYVGYSWSDAASNTGNGGGGAKYIGYQLNSPGAKGGSGIVVVRYIPLPGLTPSFGSPSATADGFTVPITNYDANYTWDTPTVTSGSVAITSTVGSNRVLTVTGLSPSGSATITQTTSRSGYSNGSNTVAGTALSAAYNPTFDSPSATADGFSVTITNYDSNYTWDTPTVTSGSVAVSAGKNWSTNSDSSGSRLWQSIASSSDGIKLAAVDNGGYIYTSTDSGVTWTGRTNADSRNWTAIASSSDGANLAAVVSSRFIYTSTDSGVNWTERRSAGSKGWNAIASSSNGTNLVATVWNDGIYTSTNAGVTWTRQTNAGTRLWRSVASSSDGTKLSAATWGGYIYTSTDSGVNWTAQTNSGSRNWYSVASSSDGSKLVAGDYNGYIYTSSNFGVSWTRQTSSGSKNWRYVASSSDGTKLSAVVFNGYIYISTDSGATWTEQTDAGSKFWSSIALSSDGTKFVAAASYYSFSEYIYTFAFQTLTVTGLSAGASATLTQTTSRSGYSNGSNTVVGTATILAALTPTFGTPTATEDGFYVTITNYDANYTWDTPTVTSGSVAITSTVGSNRVLTVTGLAPSDSTTITQTTSRSGYSNGSNTVVGTATTGAALNPTFDTPTATADGFSVTITNYDANYTWDTPTVTSGSVAITSTVGSNRVLTVTGLAPADSATITQATRRSGYSNGSNTVAGTALSAAYNPTFDSPTATTDGFYVTISNYDSNYTWDTPTVTAPGSVVVTSTGEWSTNSNSSGVRQWQSIASSSDGTKLAAAAYDGYLYTSVNSGVTWTARADTENRTWWSITSNIDGSKLAAVVNGGYIYTSTDSGVTWTAQTNAGSRGWYSIASSSDGTKLAAAVNGGSIWTSTNSGATWTESADTGPRNWQSIASSSDGTKLAAAVRNGFIYTSTNSGLTWTQQTNSASRNWNSIASSGDGTKLAAVVPNGYIYTSTDTGTTWTARTNAGIANWSSAAFSSDGTKLAAIVYNGFIYTSTNSGDTWTAQTDATSKAWTAITLSSDGTKLSATAYMINIYNYGNRLLTVTGLSAGASATITQATLRTGYANGSNTVAGTVLTPVTTANISITAPVTGATPVASITSNGQYSTTVTWNGSPATFASNTIYTATVTLTPIAGYTLTGLAANFFTVNGESATVGNLVNAGVFTKAFPVTDRTISTANISITAPATGATPVASLVSNGQYTTAITWNGSPSRFAATTVYTATVTLTPITGYTLTGVAANLFRVNSDTATTGNLVNAGTFTYRFVATGAKLAQSITFAQPTDMSLTSDTKTLTASSSATGSYPVTFTSLTTNTCTIEAGAIRVVASGICSVRASQAGDGIYLPANGVIRSIGIAENRLSQSITFTQPAAMNTRSSNQALTATSSAGNSYPVTLISNSTDICTISSRAIVVVKFGTCSITASQAGDGTYQAAASVTRTVLISKLSQTISFSQPNAMSVTSGDQGISATSSATGSYPVSFTSSDTSTCTIESGPAIRVVSSGTCIITASQAGDDTYTAAASVTRSVVISKLTQSITFEQPNVMIVGDSDQLLSATSNATGGSYPVTYASANNAICSIVGSSPTFSIRVVAPGTCSITASQVGNGTYAPAAAVVKTFVIPKLTQTITFNAIPAMTVTSGDQVLSATSSAGGSLAVRFTSTTSAVCRIINGNTLQAVSVGSCSITASQAGNATYSAAKNVIKSFVLASARRR